MTKQPVLTGFPLTVFATAKRRAQAVIQSLRKGIVKDSLSGYAVLFQNVLPSRFLEALKPEGREHHFGHTTVFWAWVAQILETNASCTKAVSFVQAWCRAHQLPVPSSDTSAYCQARGHLSEGYLDQINERVEQTLSQRIGTRDQWRGHVLMLLHQARHRKLDWRKGKKISPIERLVTWQKPTKKPETSELTDEEWENLPDEITLRYIKLGYENRTGEKAALVVVTDLLDGEKYPAEEVSDLYMERWQIELKFRDLKTTFGMESFNVKTPEMARKTLRMMIIAYNLLRITMQESAHEAGRKVNEMSVEGTRCVLTSSHESFRPVAGKLRRHRSLYLDLLANCAEHVLDIRPFRQEPRARKRRPKNYQLLTAHRHVFKKIAHREYAYRKPKQKAA